MAKIDVTKIEGFNNMSPEEKITALTEFEYEDNLSELDKYKNAASKANSEAAEWKRKHNALLSDEEKKKNAENEELTSLREKVAEMEKKELITSHKSQYLAMGYDDALAEATAMALVEGDTAKVFANQRKFLETHDKNFKAELLKDTPTPPAGGGKKTSVDDIMKITDPVERQSAIAANIELFEKEN